MMIFVTDLQLPEPDIWQIINHFNSQKWKTVLTTSANAPFIMAA